jgi:hypothetical protein
MHKLISIIVSLSIIVNVTAQKTVQTELAVKESPAAKKQVQLINTFEWVSFTDSATNINVKYPETWVLKTTNPKVLFMLTSPAEGDGDKFRENLNVIVKNLPNGGLGITLAQIADAVQAQIPTAVDNFVLYYSKIVKWNGDDAREVNYGGNNKSDGTAVNFIQRIGINRGRLVVTTYTYEGGKKDIYNATAVKIIDTIVCN